MKVSIPTGGDDTGRDGSRAFQHALLQWYLPRARPLRIRTARDPWAILVSEVMAQQTQIARVDEAWAGFMQRYPTPRALTSVSTAEVLRAWAGLGYNRRALNLQRAAATIEARHGGNVPDGIDELEALPGVGPYTARAVAAIAFGRPVAAVDTNVRRVVTRLHGEALDPARLQAVADALVDAADPATWTHASMELGAMICVARRPRCGECPVAEWCASAGRVAQQGSRERVSRLPFEQTTRWLRGRIVDRLRSLEDDDWERLPPTIGIHDSARIEAAVSAMQAEGMLERRPDGAVRLPS